MKPRLFVGSSVEGLPISYAIQENLQFDANVTIWNQGIFELSSNTLDDLLKRLGSSDFAIFIFKHDDVTQMRSSTLGTVRDNVIFEFGLFMGKLGKGRVFFVIPTGEKGLHLPTDLIGVMPGYYEDSREDGNILAALGPFCNQVRVKLKAFLFESLNDLNNESTKSKAIAVEKPLGWEYLLLSQMLEERLEPINRSLNELDKGLIFIKTKISDAAEFKDSNLGLLKDIIKLVSLFAALITDEFKEALEPPGTPTKILNTKNLADKFETLSKELMSWEYSLLELEPPEPLKKIKEIMVRWPRRIINQLNIIPAELRRVLKLKIETNGKSSEKADINLRITVAQEEVDEISNCLNSYYGN